MQEQEEEEEEQPDLAVSLASTEPEVLKFLFIRFINILFTMDFMVMFWTIFLIIFDENYGGSAPLPRTPL